LWSSESTVLNHSDTLIYLTICNAIKWWQLYSHTFNHIHLSTLLFIYLSHILAFILAKALCLASMSLVLLKLKSLLVLRALCPDCEPCARQSATEPCAPTVGLVPANLLLLFLQPLVYPSVLSMYWCLGT